MTEVLPLNIKILLNDKTGLLKYKDLNEEGEKTMALEENVLGKRFVNLMSAIKPVLK